MTLMTYDELRAAAQKVGGAASTAGAMRIKSRKERRKRIGEFFKNLFKGVGEDTLGRILKTDEVQKSIDGGVIQFLKRNWYYFAGGTVALLTAVYFFAQSGSKKSKYR